MKELRRKLLQPVDGASLAVFRMLFGGIMLYEVWRHFSSGWIARYYILPEFHFKYFAFEWVTPWPGAGMYSHFAVLGVLAAMIMVGALYRIAAILFFLGFSYVFLLEQARYLNHFYLVILLSFLLCFLPANRLWSVDAWMTPRLRSFTVPRWTVLVLVLQMEIVLIFAGIVKVNVDWLQLQPLTIWLGERADLPLIGSYFRETWAVALASYGSIALHLIGAPLLLWRRTRLWVFLIYIIFHLTNAAMFRIGIFPWLTIAATLLFFDPDWPRALWRRIRQGVLWCARPQGETPTEAQAPAFLYFPQSVIAQRVVFTGLAVFFVFQVLFPLRHLLYPGDVAWTEQGHPFSWRMKLRTKEATAAFRVSDPVTGQTWEVSRALSRWQWEEMACRPDMILQYAHQLADQWRIRGTKGVEVRADVWCALNGRRFARLIDPARDLAAVDRSLAAADWILPLNEPLPTLASRRR